MSDDDDDGGLRNTLYRTTTRSGRRMTRARRWLYRVAVPLGTAIIRAWWFTCRVTRVEGVAHLDEALARSPSLVPCYWHQHQLYCGKFLVEQRARGLTVGWLISPSVDGELGAMMVRRFGAAVIRGSSTHTGARALRDYQRRLDLDPARAMHLSNLAGAILQAMGLRRFVSANRLWQLPLFWWHAALAVAGSVQSPALLRRSLAAAAVATTLSRHRA